MARKKRNPSQTFEETRAAAEQILRRLEREAKPLQTNNARTSPQKLKLLARSASAKTSKRSVKGVRLDFSSADHERLKHCAKERGLSMASYARQAVLAMIRSDEREYSQPREDD
jgi:hypothetical protein